MTPGGPDNRSACTAALEQALQVFLHGNGLPGRWQGRDRFTVLELGFGPGQNFLATWQAWREDARRPTRLVFVSIEPRPLQLADLKQVHAASPLAALAGPLIEAWPPLTAGLHLLRFDGGRVELLLAFGDVTRVLPALRVQADAIFLGGFATTNGVARVMKAVGRRAAPGATAAAVGVAQPLHESLRAAGFEVRARAGAGAQREITVATFAPRFAPSFAPPSTAPAPRTALVIGAGLAGAAVAQALARRGIGVTVLEQHARAAAGASANPAALFHGTVHAGDGTYARLFRAAALHAAREFRAAGLAVDGLLRLATAEAAALPDAAGLPADFVRAVHSAEASALAGARLPSPAWHFASGGWAEPALWVRRALGTPGVELRVGAHVARIERASNVAAGTWSALGPGGAHLAQADLFVLANAEACSPLLAERGHAPWPLQRRRGQVSWWSPVQPHGLRLPVAGDGYAIPLPAGALLCGATRQDDDGDDTTVRHADHAENLSRLRRLTGIGPSTGAALSGWVGWRLHAEDRLPIAGAMPVAAMPSRQRLDQVRWLPREPGLFVLTALGARGLTLAPLLGELIAAQATGDAWPLEQGLADAVDPGRWLVRAARGSLGDTSR